MNEDRIIEKILDNTTRLDRIEQKITKLDSIEATMDVVVGTLDEIKGMFNRQDTEQTANVHVARRHEKGIERLEDIHELNHSIA